MDLRNLCLLKISLNGSEEFMLTLEFTIGSEQFVLTLEFTIGSEEFVLTQEFTEWI